MDYPKNVNELYERLNEEIGYGGYSLIYYSPVRKPYGGNLLRIPLDENSEERLCRMAYLDIINQKTPNSKIYWRAIPVYEIDDNSEWGQIFFRCVVSNEPLDAQYGSDEYLRVTPFSYATGEPYKPRETIKE